MAKSVVPLLLGVGAVAVVVMGGKKKKKSDSGKMTIDQECSRILASGDVNVHNEWITNRYEQMLAAGETNLEVISLNLLKEQSMHCPWDDNAKWTQLMEELYQQVYEAVNTYHVLNKLPQG